VEGRYTWIPGTAHNGLVVNPVYTGYGTRYPAKIAAMQGNCLTTLTKTPSPKARPFELFGRGQKPIVVGVSYKITQK